MGKDDLLTEVLAAMESPEQRRERERRERLLAELARACAWAANLPGRSIHLTSDSPWRPVVVAG